MSIHDQLRKRDPEAERKQLLVLLDQLYPEHTHDSCQDELIANLLDLFEHGTDLYENELNDERRRVKQSRNIAPPWIRHFVKRRDNTSSDGNFKMI